MASEWDNLSVVAKARLVEVEADEKLILSRLMDLATPNERKAWSGWSAMRGRTCWLWTKRRRRRRSKRGAPEDRRRHGHLP